LLQDEEIRRNLQAIFIERKGTRPTTFIELEFLDSNKNSLPEFNFNSDQTIDEFVKARMEEELGLVENPTQKQLEEIIKRIKSKTRPKGKTVYFKDFIDEIAKGPDNILDAEIVNQPIRAIIKNQEL